MDWLPCCIRGPRTDPKSCAGSMVLTFAKLPPPRYVVLKAKGNRVVFVEFVWSIDHPFQKLLCGSSAELFQ